MMLTRDQILNLAEKHRSKITGWYFSAAELEKFWKDAYRRGWKDRCEVWVELTDEELEKFSDAKLGSYDLCLEVEAKLRKKNNG